MNLKMVESYGRLFIEADFSSRGVLHLMFPGIDNNTYYLETLDRIYVKAHADFTKDEIKNCETFQERISNIFEQAGVHAFNKKITRNGQTTTNPNYQIAWQNIKNACRQYELYLVKCLKVHGMLMTNKVSVDTKL